MNCYAFYEVIIHVDKQKCNFYYQKSDILVIYVVFSMISANFLLPGSTSLFLDKGNILEEIYQMDKLAGFWIPSAIEI